MTVDFETWVEAVFSHPVYEQHWYWVDGDDARAASEAASALNAVQQVNYITRLFESAESLLAAYPDHQVQEGLWYLADPSFSDYMFAWQDESVSASQKQRFLESFYPLFAGCFSPRCSEHLSHKDEAGANPLNRVCYMWWDIIPMHGMPNEPRRTQADAQCLDIMHRTLTLNSAACQESALHGLGHWAIYYPAKTTAIIDNFIKAASQNANPRLMTYAMQAKTGMVN